MTLHSSLCTMECIPNSQMGVRDGHVACRMRRSLRDVRRLRWIGISGITHHLLIEHIHIIIIYIL